MNASVIPARGSSLWAHMSKAMDEDFTLSLVLRVNHVALDTIIRVAHAYVGPEQDNRNTLVRGLEKRRAAVMATQVHRPIRLWNSRLSASLDAALSVNGGELMMHVIRRTGITDGLVMFAYDLARTDYLMAPRLHTLVDIVLEFRECEARSLFLSTIKRISAWTVHALASRAMTMGMAPTPEDVASREFATLVADDEEVKRIPCNQQENCAICHSPNLKPVLMAGCGCPGMCRACATGLGKCPLCRTATLQRPPLPDVRGRRVTDKLYGNAITRIRDAQRRRVRRTRPVSVRRSYRLRSAGRLLVGEDKVRGAESAQAGAGEGGNNGDGVA